MPAAHPTPGISPPPSSLISLSYLPPAKTANLSFFFKVNSNVVSL